MQCSMSPSRRGFAACSNRYQMTPHSPQKSPKVKPCPSLTLSLCHDQTPLRKKEEEEKEGKLDSSSRRLAGDRFRWDSDNTGSTTRFPFYSQSLLYSGEAYCCCCCCCCGVCLLSGGLLLYVSRGSPYLLLASAASIIVLVPSVCSFVRSFVA